MMESEDRNEIEILRLCPESEETLNDLASTFIKTLITPKERIRESEREKAEMILTWGRRIIKFGSCLGFSQSSGIDSVESLYKYEASDFKEGLQNFKEVDNCLQLGKYIIISCVSSVLKNHTLTQIIKNIHHMSSENEEVESFFSKLWNIRDEIPLTPETLEELISVFPLCLEQFLMEIVEKVTSGNNHDKVTTILNEEMNSFCKLCAISSKIFQTSLSILHEFLLISDVHKCLAYFVTKFINCVENCCKKGEFLDLFPHELRILITFLQIHPSLYHNEFIDDDFSKRNVLKTLTYFILCNRRVGGALLSYYPEWLSYILQYSMQSNISELIPRNKEDGEEKEAYLKFILQTEV